MAERTVLSNHDLTRIRNLYAGGLGIRPLAIIFKVGDARIRRITKNTERVIAPLSLELKASIREQWNANPTRATMEKLSARHHIPYLQIKQVVTYQKFSDLTDQEPNECPRGHETDALLDGTCRMCRREQQRNAPQRPRKDARTRTEMTTKLVILIRERFAGGDAIIDMALEYRLDRKTVSDIVRGKRYPDLPGPIVERGYTEEFKERIIQLRKDFRAHPYETNMAQLGAEYGLTHSQVRRIVHGLSYKDIPGPITTPDVAAEVRKRYCRHGHDQRELPPMKDGTCRRCRRESAKKYDAKRTRRHRRTNQKVDA